MDLVEQLRRDAFAPHFTSVGAANLMLKAADEIERLRDAFNDEVVRNGEHEIVHADKRRLVRELDVALNGEAGAAKQASLCDIVGQVKDQRWKLVRADQ